MKIPFLFPTAFIATAGFTQPPVDSLFHWEELQSGGTLIDYFRTKLFSI